MSTPPSAVTAAVWYRPHATCVANAPAGVGTISNAFVEPPRPSCPASETGGEPCPPPPALSLRPAVYTAPASVTSAVCPAAAAQTTESPGGTPSARPGGVAEASDGRPTRSPPMPQVSNTVRFFFSRFEP